MINLKRKATVETISVEDTAVDAKQFTKCLLEIQKSVQKQIATSNNTVMAEKLRMHLQVINRVLNTPIEGSVV